MATQNGGACCQERSYKPQIVSERLGSESPAPASKTSLANCTPSPQNTAFCVWRRYLLLRHSDARRTYLTQRHLPHGVPIFLHSLTQIGSFDNLLLCGSR